MFPEVVCFLLLFLFSLFNFFFYFSMVKLWERWRIDTLVWAVAPSSLEPVIKDGLLCFAWIYTRGCVYLQ